MLTAVEDVIGRIGDILVYVRRSSFDVERRKLTTVVTSGVTLHMCVHHPRFRLLFTHFSGASVAADVIAGVAHRRLHCRARAATMPYQVSSLGLM